MVAATRTRHPQRQVRKGKRYNVDELISANAGVDEESDIEENDSGSEDEQARLSESQAESEDDDEYISPGRKKRRTAGSNKSSKKTKIQRRIPQTAEELGDDFEENKLYRALSDPDASIERLALDWIEEYSIGGQNGSIECVTTLVNLILRCCGCIHLLQPHDLSNLSSAKETIGELEIAFRSQKSHEYPFISNNKNLKFFKANVVEFFEEIVALSHKKGLLYIERGTSEEGESLASPLVNQVFTWLFTLTTCPIRPLRYVATTVLLVIQTQLSRAFSEVNGLLEKHQRQLSNLRKAKRKQKAQIDTVQNIVEDFNHKNETLKEYFSDVTDVVFANRYHDIDPMLRQECASALGEWMLTASDVFLQSSYLKFYGWLLSDPNNSVRSEVTKVLHKLYKQQASLGGEGYPSLRVFSDKFKGQMIKMCQIDQDPHVRSYLTLILQEMIKLDYLEYSEQTQIISSFMVSIKVGLGFSKVHNDKLISEIVRFIHTSHFSLVKETINGREQAVGDFDKVNLNESIKTRCLLQLFRDCDEVTESIETGSPISDHYPISTVMQLMYQQPYYQNMWLFWVKCLSGSFNEIEVGIEDDDEGLIQDTLTAIQDISRKDCLYLSNFILGALSTICNKNKTEQSSVDSADKVVLNFSEFAKPIFKVLQSEVVTVDVLVKIWSLILGDYNKTTNVYSTFLSCEKGEVYFDINCGLINLYSEAEVDSFSDKFFDNFDIFFGCILSDYELSMTSEIKSSIDNVIKSLSTDSLKILEESSGFGGLPEDNKWVQASMNLLKLTKISNYINIDRFLNENLLLEELRRKMLDRFSSAHSFATKVQGNVSSLDTEINALKAVLDFIIALSAAKISHSLKTERYESEKFEEFNSVITSLASSYKASEFEEACRQYDQESSNEDWESYFIMATKCNEIQTYLKTAYADLIIGFKMFFEKQKTLPVGGDFYSDFQFQVQNMDSPVAAMMEVFVEKEEILGHLLGIELARESEETASLFGSTSPMDTFSGLFYVAKPVSIPQEDSDVDQEQVGKVEELELKRAKEKSIWQAEYRFCGFAIKLLTLESVGLIKPRVSKRIRLNSNKIGGLFNKIVSSYETDSSQNAV